MDRHLIVLPVICIVAILLAGCTASSPVDNQSCCTPTATVTTVPAGNQTCTTYADCVPAQCCEGPLDCGAGSCGCINGRCSVVPATSSTKNPQTSSLKLTASPQRYTPLMSSTVGVGIDMNASGFDPASSQVTWNATYGKFLSWGPVNYTVQDLGNPVTNHGEKLYWSFIEKPSSTLEPVIITVTATDPATARVLGSSRVILAWDGDFAVMVREIQ
jgi:hypothetical protein